MLLYCTHIHIYLKLGHALFCHLKMLKKRRTGKLVKVDLSFLVCTIFLTIQMSSENLNNKVLNTHKK